jgi:hypothetical protein
MLEEAVVPYNAQAAVFFLSTVKHNIQQMEVGPSRFGHFTSL